MTRARIAVIPAAGIGTRMRPATVAVPKELLPVGGRPAIDWVLDEALLSGIERVIVVTSPMKPAIETYLSAHQASGRHFSSQRDTSPVTDGRLQVEVVHQLKPAGLGDAIRLTRPLVGDEPVAVLLPDELMLGGSDLLTSMLDHHDHGGAPVVSVMQVGAHEISSYGCAAVSARDVGEIRTVSSCIEKPEPTAAPSLFALCGRYVIDQLVFEALETVHPDGRGEVRFTPALDQVARRIGLNAIEVHAADVRIDVGNWPGWLEANQHAFSIAPLLAAPLGHRQLSETARIA